MNPVSQILSFFKQNGIKGYGFKPVFQLQQAHQSATPAQLKSGDSQFIASAPFHDIVQIINEADIPEYNESHMSYFFHLRLSAIK